MLNFLKQVLLWLYFGYRRSSKRKAIVEKVTCKCNRRNYIDDIPDIPAKLDEVCELPEGIEDAITFTAFDKSGNSLVLHLQRYQNGKETVHLDIDLPGFGHYSYKEKLQKRGTSNHLENLCRSRRLQLYCHQPMRRWRIYFRGPMTNVTEKSKTRVTASVYWQCLSDPYDHFVSCSCWTLAGYLSNLSCKNILTSSFDQDPIRYEQLGEMRARICIANQELNVRLKCIKERIFNTTKAHVIENVQRQYVVLERTGLFLSSHEMCTGKNATFSLGYVVFPIGDYSPTQQKEEGLSSGDSPVTITACGNTYEVSKSLKRFVFGNNFWNYNYVAFLVSGNPAFGMLCSADGEIENNEDNGEICDDQEFVDNQHDTVAGEETILTTLNDPECRMRTLTGGKGSQLALLKSFGICNVPDGICLTANAYRKHLLENTKLQAVIDQISECVKSGHIEKLESVCENAVRIFEETPLSDELKLSIRNLWDQIFPTKKQSLTFAVRSSSVSEDGSQVSSAGQLNTILGVQDSESMFEAVRKCWASSVAYQVVEYRRQNGQSLTENMAVVIQEMIDSDVAGVLFTNNPVDGDETTIVINALYGLGEVVVSGTITPDTITVKRSENGSLKVESISVGDKEFRMTANTGKSRTEKNNTEADKKKACLQQKEIYQLCELALEIERKMQAPQDVEWAIYNGSVFILQTRPITTVDMETDEQIMHEFDTPVMSDIELITPCNVQEAIPGASSTLCTDVHLPAVDRSSKYNVFSRLGLKYPIHVSKITLSFGGLALFGITPIMPLVTHGVAGEKAKSNTEFNLLGMAVDEQTLENINEFYGRTTSKKRKMINVAREYFILRRRDTALYEQIKRNVEKVRIGEAAITAEALYKAIDENLYLYYEMWRAMVYITAKNGMQIAIMMNVLKGSSTEMSVENAADIALLLSECKNVLSAEVPADINNLAELISNSEIRETFLSLPIAACDSLLIGVNIEELQSKYVQFMERHGHRCIKESDFFEKTWSQDPSKLIKMLRMVVRQGSFQTKKKTKLSIDELVDSLKTPMSPFKKRLMKRFLVRNAMEGVAERERAKSFAMKACAIFKDAYWKLAEYMIREGRLPDENLLFFLTHREIGILIEHRPIKLIRLAKRRLRLLPEMDKARFEKVNLGVPQPVTEHLEQTSAASFTLKGMPVCRGQASGRACVIKTLDDANELTNGDILICRYTDVGWTPYFPIINGLVTELGGIVSHGAVIARENGIPCVVNVANATELFKTGDKVILDGTAGTVCKSDTDL